MDGEYEQDGGRLYNWRIGDAENEDDDDCWSNILKVIMLDTFKRCDRNNTNFSLKIHFLSNLNLDVNILVSRFD